MEKQSRLILNDSTGFFEEIAGENEDFEIHVDTFVEKRKHFKNMRLMGKKYGSKGSRKLISKRCNHLAEKKTQRSFLCGAFEEERRNELFKYFWSIPSWDAKKVYIRTLVEIRSAVRRRLTTTTSKKVMHFDCFLPQPGNEKMRVCKVFFLQTFNLDKSIFQLWLKNKVPIPRKEKQLSSASVSALKWLNIIPKIPSHYCRAKSARIYIEESFKTKTQMFSVYTQWCSENNVNGVKRTKFFKILENQKISIFKPRKDRCDICVAYEEGNINKEQFNLHITKKNEAKDAKVNAIRNISSKNLVITMDMQSVLQCPKLNVSEQYYKSKLLIHNFTIYVKNDKRVYMYVWHEGEGGVTANNITSCIIDFLNQHCLNYEKVVLISDGCTYQNKNKVLCSALSNFSLNSGIEIEQLILEKGHTMMEVDSVHSTLERAFKGNIYCPSDYIAIMRQVRPNQPYIVNYLDYTFFKNYENVSGNFLSIRPGNKSGDSTVNDIRGLLFTKNEVKYKIRHSQAWKKLPQKRSELQVQTEVHSLYKNQLKIELTKYKQLQSLKKYMHKDHHSFYDNLNH